MDMTIVVGGRSREHGQTLVLSVLFMTAILMMLGLVIDGGMYMKQKRDLQGAVDSGALAGAQELVDGEGPARIVATDYVENQNLEAGGTVELIEIDGGLVRVTATSVGNTSFGALMGLSDPTITATAAARLQMLGPTPGMLPMAFMRDSYSIGDNVDVKFDGNATGNRGAISPPIEPPGCPGAAGASDFRDTIKGADNGGVDACGVGIGDTIPVETGNMAGPSRQGFDSRLGGNSQSFSDVFDCSNDPCTIEDPSSPRIGIVPVVERDDGAAEWPSGSSANVRVLSYMLVYIGKQDSPGYPAYTNGGKNVWVTPVQAVWPDESTGQFTEFVDYDGGSDSPVVFRLVE